MAEAANAWVGMVQFIEEGDRKVPRAMPMPMAMAADARSVPVMPGEQEVRVSVTVRFLLE